MLAAVVLVGGVWWAASDDDVTTVRSGGDVAALADGPPANGTTAGSAANDHAGGPGSPAGTGPAANPNEAGRPDGALPGHTGDAVAAGRQPTTTTTAGTPGTTPAEPDSTPFPTTPPWPPTTVSTARPTPPSTGHPGGGPPTTGTSTTTSTSRPGPGHGPDWFLVYTRDASQTDPADTDLFIGDLEGRHERQLTIGPDRDQFPAWSPDGSTIAFNRITRGGSDELWSIRADGSGLRQLTFGGAGAKHEPTWSPDGRFLAFTAAYFNPTRVSIEILNLATGQMTKITPGPMDGQPLWSPDGTTIVYTARSANGEDDDLFAVNPNGSGRRAITAAPLDYESERYDAFGWSADGNRLLVYYKHPNEGHIITLRPDGTGRQDILSDREPAPGQQGSGTLGFLTWSPDEQMIVFNSYNGLRAVNSDGTGLRLIDPPDGGRWMADWQPS